jgi:hypothetical protein
MHKDLLEAQKLVYGPNGWVCEHLEQEMEGKEYGACRFQVNQQRVLFRVGKITPTKNGQFVTCWKRVGMQPILPYDEGDPIDLMIVSVRSSKHFGQFVFSKKVLCEKGILSIHGQGGKRAFRVYPPWDMPENQQAKKTQEWQMLYFYEISPCYCDPTRVQRLFSS